MNALHSTVLFAAIAASPTYALACTCGTQPIVAWPQGADVALNVRPIVSGFPHGTTGGRPIPEDVALVGPDGAVEVLEERTDLSHLWSVLLIPAAALAPNTTYQVVAGQETLTTFQTGQVSDTEAPLPPETVASSSLPDDPCTMTSCGPFAWAVHEIDSANEQLVARVSLLGDDGEPVFLGAMPYAGGGIRVGKSNFYDCTRGFTPEGLLPGDPVCVRVVLTDLAGNAAAPVEPGCVTLPDPAACPTPAVDGVTRTEPGPTEAEPAPEAPTVAEPQDESFIAEPEASRDGGGCQTVGHTAPLAPIGLLGLLLGLFIRRVRAESR